VTSEKPILTAEEIDLIEFAQWVKATDIGKWYAWEADRGK
jgi:hypothetical protein